MTRIPGEEIRLDKISQEDMNKLSAVIKIFVETDPRGLILAYSSRDGFAEWMQSLDVEKRGDLIETICADLKEHLIERAVKP